MSDNDKVTSDPQSPLYERLDRIEAALLKLVDAVSAVGSVSAAARPSPTPAPARPVGPKPVRVAAPRTAHSATQDAAAGSAAGGVERPADPYEDRVDLHVPPPDATPREVLVRIFEAALMEDAEDTWALLARLTHADALSGPRSLDHFKAFQWHKARRSAPVYLDETRNPASCQIAYTDPGELSADTTNVKVFVAKPGGQLPAPVTLRRDPNKQNAWRLVTMSL